MKKPQRAELLRWMIVCFSVKSKTKQSAVPTVANKDGRMPGGGNKC